MRRRLAAGPRFGVIPAALLGAALLTSAAAAQDDTAIVRGEYVFRAAGCESCHTDREGGGAWLSGGRVLETPVGRFISPNLTPDSETGIGGWSEGDLARALRHGIAPDGSNYYPAFPYPAYSGMTDADIGDLKAFLDSVPPVHNPTDRHELAWPYSWRILLGLWKLIGFSPGPFERDPARSEAWNRGAYLVTVLGHCGECHTPRGGFGLTDEDSALAGTAKGPDGKRVPNITPDPETGIGGWSARDIVRLLRRGFDPEGDDVQGAMAEVVEHGTRHLHADDLEAIAVYLLELAPIRHATSPPSPTLSP